MRWPLPVRPWGDPPVLRGLGAGAGEVSVRGWGSGADVVGEVGAVGVVLGAGAEGAGTCSPGSWMSSTELPGGTSTVTGTTWPLGSLT